MIKFAISLLYSVLSSQLFAAGQLVFLQVDEFIRLYKSSPGLIVSGFLTHRPRTFPPRCFPVGCSLVRVVKSFDPAFVAVLFDI